MTLQEHLISLDACQEAKDWAGSRTARQAWDECERADWLLWWASQTEANGIPALTHAKCDCARTALKYIPEGELRPLQAIEAAERWADAPTEENYVRMVEARRACSWYRVTAAAAASAAVYAAAAAEGAEAAAHAIADTNVAAAVANAVANADRPMCGLIREQLVLPWSEEPV